MRPGKFITIEGIEGVGKTTIIQFLHQLLSKLKTPVVLTREPGGTDIAEKIRELLLAHHHETMVVDTELLLMFAARAQHIATVILPHLEAGHIVLCDRFTEASFAYQGGGRGVPAERISALSAWTHATLAPDAVLLLDAPVTVALARATKRGALDRIEQETVAFFERVRKAYLERAQQYTERYHVIDASSDLDHVKHQVQQALFTVLKAHP